MHVVWGWGSKISKIADKGVPKNIIFLRTLFAVFLGHKISTSPQDEDGGDGEDRSTPGKCPVVPPTSCAVLYDDENCKGWSFEVPTGTSEIPEEFRNDAEVVVVRSGCKLTGEGLPFI